MIIINLLFIYVHFSTIIRLVEQRRFRSKDASIFRRRTQTATDGEKVAKTGKLNIFNVPI